MPRAACPVKCEAYLTRVRGEHHFQLRAGNLCGGERSLQEETKMVLATLTPREEKVLRMRFGIGEKADHTLEEVGHDFELTRERIRQIEVKALRKLKHPMRSNKLKIFLEG